MDSDDVALSSRLTKQINFIEKKNYALVGSWFSRIDNDNNIIEKIRYKMRSFPYVRKILFFNIIGHSTIMFKKDIIKKIGSYPNRFKFMQDYAFFLKVYKNFKINIIENNLTNCRYHHQNSETFRVSNSYLIEEEEKKLLYWTKKNFNLNILELFYYYYCSFKLRIKIARKFFNFLR